MQIKEKVLNMSPDGRCCFADGRCFSQMVMILKDETVKMEDTKMPRVKEFQYLGSTVQESGNCKREVKKRMQAGWNV